MVKMHFRWPSPAQKTERTESKLVCNIHQCTPKNPSFIRSGTIYSIPPYKRSLYKGRIYLNDILGWRRPVGFVRKSYFLKGGNPVSDMSAPQPTPTTYTGVYCIVKYPIRGPPISEIFRLTKRFSRDGLGTLQSSPGKRKTPLSEGLFGRRTTFAYRVLDYRCIDSPTSAKVLARPPARS
jgi:hypothetical protein